VTYAVTLALADGVARYPISATADLDAAGRLSARWDAPAVPLAPLAGALPSDAPVHVDAGWLEDVSVAYGSSSPLRLQGDHRWRESRRAIVRLAPDRKFAR